MKAPLCLRLEPRPTRIGLTMLIVAHALTGILVACLPLPSIAIGACTAAMTATFASGYRRLFGRSVPTLLLVGADRRISVGDADGTQRDGSILDDSFVGEWLTSIVWQRDGDPWWRPARSILVLPDTLPREDRRALRVAMRYGRAPRVDKSALDAG